jgi:Eco57I restriction-modification methylase
VRLTELRLWLALVVDCDDADVTRVTPLPNLDGHVRQGDSLLDPLALAQVLGAARVTVGRRTARIAEARRRLFAQVGHAKRAASKALVEEEAAVAAELYGNAIASLEARIAGLVADARQPDLFGRRAGLDARSRGLLVQLRRCRLELRSSLRRLKREGDAPFFAFESHFAEIAATGFDLVVGNPPWVRGERVPSAVREALAARYASWRPVAARGYAHLPDLAVAFVERGIELTAPGGATALLVPAKLATSGYAEPLRRRMTTTTRVTNAAPVDARAAAAFGAAVYPMALVAARVEPDANTATATGLGPPQLVARVPQATLREGPWVLVPDAQRLAQRLRAAFPTLGERWTPQLGVKTGADELFLTTELLAGTLQALRGRDLCAFRATPCLNLLWTHDANGRPLERLPEALAARLLPHVERLRRRADYRSGPPWQLFRMALARASHRVLWPDLARRLTAVAPGPQLVPLNTVYGVATRGQAEAHALAALLNARWLTALARLHADPARGGFHRFNARVVGQLPIPRAAHPGWQALAALGAQRETDDALVADLLELDAADQRALDRSGASR